MPPSVGTRLGSYEVVAPLGAGGMGEVFRARDPRLERDVAIKVLPAHLASDPQALARFEKEAKAVAALSHPNILAIYDVGTDRGITYAVMELLEGETLRDRLGRGALPWRKAVEIGASIAEGLSAAHGKGIVHRDLKPENVFLTEDGRVKILDFGLARREPLRSPADPNDTSAPTQTEPGTVLGTVGYMSPEQVRGKVAETPSDIFSLGCVLYEMISGRRAFARETAVQTMTSVLEHDPPPLARTAPQIPPELGRVVERCLEKSSLERPQSARDLGHALKDLANRPETSPALRVAYRISLRSALAAAVALVALVGAVVLYRLTRAEPTSSIAVLPFVNASGNPEMDYLGDGITESLINSLSEVPRLSVISRNSAFRYKGRQDDARAAGQALQAEAVLTGRVVEHGDDLSISAELIQVRDNRHLWGEQYNRKVRDILAIQEEISTSISSALRLKLGRIEKGRSGRAYTQNTEAYQLYLQGRYWWNKKTEAGFRKGIALFEQAIALDPKYAPAYAGLANLYYNLANYNFALLPAKEAWPKAKAASARALELDDSLAAAHAAAALVAYQWEWDWATADREFKRALELDPGSSTTYEPTPASTNHWYAHYLMSVGRKEESLRASRRALELDPVDLGINAHQGWHYLFTRQYDQAVEPLQRTIEMEPSFPVAQWYLGFAFEQQGKSEDAIARFANCVRLTGDRPSMLALVGHAYAAAGRSSEARVVLTRLEELSKDRYVPPYPVAAIEAALGDKDAALRLLEKAYEDRDSWMDYLGVDPRLDSLRSDPRFTALLRSMRLEAFLPR